MLEIERNIFQIFPINIFVEKQFLSEEQCDLILKSIKKEKTLKHSFIAGDGSSSYFLNADRCDILSKLSKPLENIKDKIQERIEYFTNSAKLVPCRLGQSWFNIQNENSRLLPHSHEFSIVSGALYINNNDSSFKLDFLNPNYSAFSGNHTSKDAGVASFEFEKGTLIIFPSYLVHGNICSENLSKNRVVISFNTFHNF